MLSGPSVSTKPTASSSSPTSVKNSACSTLIGTFPLASGKSRSYCGKRGRVPNEAPQGSARIPMKAIVYHRYGGSEVLALEDVEKPTPADDEVLVRVRAAAVNPYDWHFMRGEPLFVRLVSGL